MAGMDADSLGARIMDDEHFQRIAYACEQVLYRFTAHFDAGEFREMEDYFAPEGVWKRHEGDIVGIAALRERMAARKPDRLMRHLITNPRVTILADDHVRIDSYVTLYMHVFGSDRPAGTMPLNGAIVVGRYHDELRLIEGRWKIVLRAPTHDFKRTTE